MKVKPRIVGTSSDSDIDICNDDKLDEEEHINGKEICIVEKNLVKMKNAIGGVSKNGV